MHETARGVLRRATAARHERVDRLFSRADLSTGSGYGRFLVAQAGSHLPIKAALTHTGAADVLHGLRTGGDLDHAARTGLALAALKHSLPGDAGLVRQADVDAYLEGGLDVRR